MAKCRGVAKLKEEAVVHQACVHMAVCRSRMDASAKEGQLLLCLPAAFSNPLMPRALIQTGLVAECFVTQEAFVSVVPYKQPSTFSTLLRVMMLA